MSVQEAIIVKRLRNGQPINLDLLARLDDGGPVGAGIDAVRHEASAGTHVKKARAAR